MELEWLNLLERLSMVPGPPGFEDEVRKLIRAELEGEVDELYTDPFGNLYTVKHGHSERKLMVAAHMDEVALIVRYVEERGFLRVTNLGGLNPMQLLAQRVMVHGKEKVRGVVGALPVHMGKGEPPTMEDLYVDIGASSREEVSGLGIGPGTPITLDVPFHYKPETESVIGKALDDRLGCLVLVEALKRAKPEEATVYGVFTAQEERGMRGATVAVNRIEPDLAFVLEGTIASDVPGVQPFKYVTELGKGPAIRVMDRTVIVQRWLLDEMVKRAEELGIPYQLQLSPTSGTDAAAISVGGKGTPVGIVSVPARYIHTPSSLAKVNDINNTIKLVSSLMEHPPMPRN
ncbi:MAG: M42 family metallopeptidase [Candidatus Korarchaeota archaeon]|nr:M42 family metallopeptidase [Candidatus Korarchaeota archaeon]